MNKIDVQTMYGFLNKLYIIRKNVRQSDNTVLTTLEVTTYRWLSKLYHTLECIFFYHLYIVTLYWYVYNICAIVIIMRCGTRREQIYMTYVYKYIFFVFLHACKHVVMLLLLLLLLCYNQKDSGNILLYYSCLCIKEKYHSNYH